MDDNAKDVALTKTIILAILAVAFGIFFFCYKIEACKSSVEDCRDEFLSISNGYTLKCSPGAHGEIVKEPKEGMICHCDRPKVPAPSDSH